MSNGGVVVLRDQRDGDGVRRLTARISDGGDLVIEGHDLGPGVEAVWGSGIGEYEWARTVRAAYLPRLRAALGSKPCDDVLSALAGWCDDHGAMALTTFLQTERIPVESWSRVSD